MSGLTPYDTGARLEPHVWVHDQVASPGGLPRRANESDYGRVDFDDDAGTTVLTLFVERASYGYKLTVDQHSDDYVRVVGTNGPPALIEPAVELDVEYRARQMMLLDAGLREIADTFADHVFYAGESDPLTFSPGHFVFHPFESNDGTWFAIEELYERGDSWADDDRVPIGWAWREQGPVRLPDGTARTALVAEGTTIPSDIDSLLGRARSWAQTVSERAEAAAVEHGLSRSARPSDPHHDGPTR